MRWAVATALLLVVFAVVPQPIAAEEAPTTSGSTLVQFDVNVLPLGSLNISIVLDAQVALSSGSISPGQTVNASATVSVPTSVAVDITYLGHSTSVTVPGLGTTYEVAVPGLGLSYLGVALGVFLNFSGVVTGESSVAGPGTGGGGFLTWATSESDSFAITADSSAPDGSVISSQLSDMRYGVSMGLDAGAEIPVLGSYVLHLLNFGSIGLFTGQPSSVESSYNLPQPGPVSALAGGANPATGLAILFIVVAAVVGGVVYFARRARKRASTATSGAPTFPESSSIPPPPPTR